MLSTSARNIRPTTACCGSCSSSTERRSSAVIPHNRLSALWVREIGEYRQYNQIICWTDSRRLSQLDRQQCRFRRSAPRGCSASRSQSAARFCASSRASCHGSCRIWSGSVPSASTSEHSRRFCGRFSAARDLPSHREVGWRAAHHLGDARRWNGRRHSERLDGRTQTVHPHFPAHARTRSIAC